jgi:hypothetical protein
MTKIYLISSREPNGATWLINALLEVGIKTSRRTYGGTWLLNNDGSYKLNPLDDMLKKWLPILSTKEIFHFRSDIEVEWAHEYPQIHHKDHKVLYFIRDPRDSLYSRFKRESHNISFAEFIKIPEPTTLLNKIDNWVLFNTYWLNFKDLFICKFEDYKKDEETLFRSILSYLNLDIEKNEIALALENSTFEKAKQCELEFLKNNPDDQETVIRSGKPDQWKLLEGDVKETIVLIEKKTTSLLHKFNYQLDNKESTELCYNDFSPNIELLDFFKNLLFNKDEILKKDSSSEEPLHNINNIYNFIGRINYYKKNYNKAYLFELNMLVNSSIILFHNLSFDVKRKIESFDNEIEDRLKITNSSELYSINSFFYSYFYNKNFWVVFKKYFLSNKKWFFKTGLRYLKK